MFACPISSLGLFAMRAGNAVQTFGQTSIGKSSRRMPWSDEFEDPIPLPKGRKLVTLLDAGNYINGLPRKEAHWSTGSSQLKPC
jgi:hypothetical protein